MLKPLSTYTNKKTKWSHQSILSTKTGRYLRNTGGTAIEGIVTISGTIKYEVEVAVSYGFVRTAT